MKTIFLILISLGLTKNVVAQSSFSFNFTDTCFITGTNTNIDIEGAIENKTNAPRQMSLLIKNINMPSDWSIVLCDPQHCLPLGVIFSVFTMNPNQTAPMFVYFNVGNIAGIGTIEIEVTNLSNSEKSVWTLKVDATTTGTINYQLQQQKPILVEWFDFQGQRISDIETVPSGVYIQRLSFEKSAPTSSQIYVNNH